MCACSVSLNRLMESSLFLLKLLVIFLKISKIHHSRGPLAQLVEHRTFNPLVVRSNRTRPTTLNSTQSISSLNWFLLLFLLSANFLAGLQFQNYDFFIGIPYP